jgi:hypothetical protein
VLKKLCPEVNARTDSQMEILAGFLHTILVPRGDSQVLPHSYLTVKAWWNTVDHV